ncbi:MAG TPA: MarR family transcriptional regulator [Clostridia bacterium]|nr:MarR family transcriptional regulator [Clostridia bacterium]
MDESFAAHLDALLQGAFQSVLSIEERMLSRMGQFNLSINEVHLLDAVGKAQPEGITIGELAKALSLTPPSVTVAVNKLAHKELVQKTKGAQDGRTVRITLTETGVKVSRIHHRFHLNMVRGIAGDMTDSEKEILLRAMVRLNEYFEKKLIANPAKAGAKG